MDNTLELLIQLGVIGHEDAGAVKDLLREAAQLAGVCKGRVPGAPTAGGQSQDPVQAPDRGVQPRVSLTNAEGARAQADKIGDSLVKGKEVAEATGKPVEADHDLAGQTDAANAAVKRPAGLATEENQMETEARRQVIETDLAASNTEQIAIGNLRNELEPTPAPATEAAGQESGECIQAGPGKSAADEASGADETAGRAVAIPPNHPHAQPDSQTAAFSCEQAELQAASRREAPEAEAAGDAKTKANASQPALEALDPSLNCGTEGINKLNQTIRNLAPPPAAADQPGGVREGSAQPEPLAQIRERIAQLVNQNLEANHAFETRLSGFAEGLGALRVTVQDFSPHFASIRAEQQALRHSLDCLAGQIEHGRNQQGGQG